MHQRRLGGQTEKNSLRAHVFRFAPKFGPRSTWPHFALGAKSRHSSDTRVAAPGPCATPGMNVAFYARLQCAGIINAGKPTGADLPGCRRERDFASGDRRPKTCLRDETYAQRRKSRPHDREKPAENGPILRQVF